MRSPGCSATAGVWLTELAPVRADLESIFLDLTDTDVSAPATERGTAS